MKPTELMIGDWVLLFDKYPAKVEAIGDTDAYLLDDDGVRWNVGYAFIKPIPLTAEILEKNGKRRDDNETVTTFFFDDGGHITHAARTKKRCDEIQILGRSIRYVHELQHALRFCGVEKEIVR